MKIVFNMDYTKFYLKNYEPETSAESDENEKEKIIFPRLEARRQPEIIYINPDGEVFDPELENMKSRRDNCTDNELSDDNAANYYGKINGITGNGYGNESASGENFVKVSRKQRKEQKKFANAFCQTVLIFAIIVMTLIVSADFLTDGKVIAAIAAGFSAEKLEYYAVLENPETDMTSSRVDSYAMRLKGGAGFIVKNGENYYNVFAVYDDISDAKDHIKQNGGELITLSTDYYDNVTSDLKNYTDYPKKVCDDLTKIASQLTSQQISAAEALEKINTVKEDFAVVYNNMTNVAPESNDDKSVTLLANASVAVSALEYLCDATASRPNLVCDIRYTVCRIIFTYCYSE